MGKRDCFNHGMARSSCKAWRVSRGDASPRLLGRAVVAGEHDVRLMGVLAEFAVALAEVTTEKLIGQKPPGNFSGFAPSCSEATHRATLNCATVQVHQFGYGRRVPEHG
eukprot:16439010-Heterocapsa_arctica.AAC.1